MAKIREKKELLLTYAEAESLIRNADGRVAYGIFLRNLLVTELNEEAGTMRGFEGCAIVNVSRAQMLKAIKDLIGPRLNGEQSSYEARGGRLRIHVDPPSYEGGHAHINLL